MQVNSSLPHFAAQLIFFLFASVYTKRNIQRAETEETGKQEYSGKNQKHNRKCSGYDICVIQYKDNNSGQYPDPLVNSTHVFFHFYFCLIYYDKQLSEEKVWKCFGYT